MLDQAVGDQDRRRARGGAAIDLRQRRAVVDGAAGHGGRLDHAAAERRDQPAGDADQTGRREHDEADEQQAEPEQPMRRPDRQEFAEQDEEQRAERRPEEAAHPADHHHGDELARERHRQRLGRGKAMIEHRERSGDRHHRGGEHEGDELVAVGRVADEAGALLVLADRHQHAADRRAMKAPQHVADRHGRSRRRRSNRSSRAPDRGRARSSG